VVPFQAAGWDNPVKLFRSQGFYLPIDRESRMAVFFADAERKDLLQIKEAADDVLPLFVVNRFDVAPLVLPLFDFPNGSKGEATSGEPGGETWSEDNRKETS